MFKKLQQLDTYLALGFGGVVCLGYFIVGENKVKKLDHLWTLSLLQAAPKSVDISTPYGSCRPPCAGVLCVLYGVFLGTVAILHFHARSSA